MSKKVKAPNPIQPMPPIKVGNPHPPVYTTQEKKKPKHSVRDWRDAVQDSHGQRREAEQN